jgi:hypothetical protein
MDTAYGEVNVRETTSRRCQRWSAASPPPSRVFVGIVVRHIGAMIHACPTTAPPPPGVPILGVRVPVSIILAAAVTMLVMPLLAEFMTHLRRRRRDRNDQCLDCGYQLTTWRGHCPGCGVRVGPG